MTKQDEKITQLIAERDAALSEVDDLKYLLQYMLFKRPELEYFLKTLDWTKEDFKTEEDM
ncbi:hypothetical protein [Lacticaseibacillus saniviri]